MYECPNCSSNLKFNIAYQQLACEHCDSRFDISKMDEGKGVEENKSFDVTIFTCSQCGGELYTTDNTIAGFCSFCGSTTIVKSRIEKELRPDYILPFFKTKEDCKKAYMERMRWAIFAPNALKKEKYIDSFRGIYMPYWLYDVKEQGSISVRGTTSKYRGDDIITTHYMLSADVDLQYDKSACDGSSSFSDNISRKIAPFMTSRLKEFSPAYLCGFYADTADVDATVYEESVIEETKERMAEYIRKHREFEKYTIKDDYTLAEKFNPKIDNVSRAMFPVWFLSYRNGDRVAYATVNGQTGKVVTDLPVDIKKYLFGTVLLTMPIFVLMNLFVTFRPESMLSLIALFSMIVAILHASEMNEIVVREEYEDDEGIQALYENEQKKQKEESMKAERELAMALGEEYLEPINMVEEMQKNYKSNRRERNLQKRKSKIRTKAKDVKLIIAMTIYFFFIVYMLYILFPEFPYALLITIVAMTGTVIAHNKSCLFAKDLKKRDKIQKSIFCLLSVGIALAIIIVKPVSDGYYYVGAIVSLVAIFFTLWDLIKKYNILSTRKLPQFAYKGGDDRA